MLPPGYNKIDLILFTFVGRGGPLDISYPCFVALLKRPSIILKNEDGGIVQEVLKLSKSDKGPFNNPHCQIVTSRNNCRESKQLSRVEKIVAGRKNCCESKKL